jgi:hypothetical protein
LGGFLPELLVYTSRTLSPVNAARGSVYVLTVGSGSGELLIANVEVLGYHIVYITKLHLPV